MGTGACSAGVRTGKNNFSFVTSDRLDRNAVAALLTDIGQTVRRDPIGSVEYSTVLTSPRQQVSPQWHSTVQPASAQTFALGLARHGRTMPRRDGPSRCTVQSDHDVPSA